MSSKKVIPENTVIRIHPSDIKIRKKMPPPDRPHERKKYSRKVKHKNKQFQEED